MIQIERTSEVACAMSASEATRVNAFLNDGVESVEFGLGSSIALSVLMSALPIAVLAQGASSSSVTPTRVLVTVETSKGANAPEIKREDVMVYEGHDRDKVTEWRPPVAFAPYLDDVAQRLTRQYWLTFTPKPGQKSGMQRVRVTTELPNVELVGPDKVYVQASP